MYERICESAADGRTAFFILLKLLDKPDGFSKAMIHKRINAV
jgi:hypothetical protein